MLNQYEVSVRVDGHYVTESRSCPAQWRGSGCYDIEVPTWCNAAVEVWANSEEAARQFAAGYDYEMDGYTIEVDNAKVTRVTLVRHLPGRDDEEAGVIEPVGLGHWEEDEDYAEDILIERGRERYLEEKYGI